MATSWETHSVRQFSLLLKQSVSRDEIQQHLCSVLNSIGIRHYSATLIKFYRENVYLTSLIEHMPNGNMTIEQLYNCKTKSSLARMTSAADTPFFWDLSIFSEDIAEDVRLRDYLLAERLEGGFSVPITHSFSTITTFAIGLPEVGLYQDQEYLLHSIALHLIDALMRLRFPIPAERDFSRNRKQSPPLSPREAEIISWIALGKSSWETSKILGISEHTVNDHIENSVRKLCARNRTEAVAIALLTHQVDLTRHAIAV